MHEIMTSDPNFGEVQVREGRRRGLGPEIISDQMPTGR